MSGDDHCPSEQTLIDYAAGTLSSDSADSVGEHLERCTPCAEAIDWIKCHLLRPRWEEDDEEPTGIGIHSESGTSTAVAEDGGEDFEWGHLSQSLLEGAVGRLGAYDILGTIGQGAMGVVLRGWDERLRRYVAIKVLRKSLNSHSNSKQRFLREARAAAAIHHPHVVTIYTVDEFRGVPYFVMELVAGRNLRQILSRETRLDFDRIGRISEQLASAVAAAHSQQILHRDLKPSNFLIDDVTGCGKLTDFGLAKWWTEASDLTAGEFTVGTPAYMAPEQVTGNACDYRSDLFALGCIFYELAAGKSPFRGRGQMGTLFRLDAYKPPALRTVRPDIPQHFSDLVGMLLEKDPAHRVLTAEDVVEALREWRNGETRIASTPVFDEPLEYPHSGVAKLDLGLPSGTMAAMSASSVGTESGPDLLAMGMNRQNREGRLPRLPSSFRQMGRGLVMALLVVAAWYLGSQSARPGREQETNLSATTARREVAEGPREHRAAAEFPARLVSQEGPLRGTSQLIHVRQDGSGDVRSLVEALRMARPGSRILIGDQRTYEESIRLMGPGFRGVTIEATGGATLRHPTASALITLDGVLDVTISGLRLETGGDQQACEIFGPCAGSRLEKLLVEQPANAEVVAVRFHPGAGGGVNTSCQLTQSTLRGPRLLEIAGSPAASAGWIAVSRNRFEGTGTVASGTAISLYGALHDVTVDSNLVVGERVGIEWTPTQTRQIEGLRIADNRFFSCEQWLLVAESFLDQGKIEIEQNLLARVSGFGLSDSGLSRVEKQWFFGNAWEVPPSDPAVDRSRARRVAELYDLIPFVSREPGSRDFLVLEKRLTPELRKDEVRR